MANSDNNQTGEDRDSAEFQEAVNEMSPQHAKPIDLGARPSQPKQGGISEEDLLQRFTYHPPKAGQPEIYQELRSAALDFAKLIVRHVPAGREQSSAVHWVELAVMEANAGIARRG